MTKLEELEQKIVEMMPELWQEGEQVYRRDDEGYSILDRIMLEDVLMATSPVINDTGSRIVNLWQFGKSLSEQSKETINSLHKILIK